MTQSKIAQHECQYMVRHRALRRPPLCERRGIALSLIQRCDSCIRTGTGVRLPRVESLRTSKSRAGVLFAATSVGEAHAFGRIFGPRFRACRVLKENYVANIYIKYRDRLERLLGEFAKCSLRSPSFWIRQILRRCLRRSAGRYLPPGRAATFRHSSRTRGMQSIGSGAVRAMGISASPWLRTVPFDSEGLTVQV